ncbi:MAG: cell envelope integrity protein CreD, partial [Azoarcus sp.]|nr:cell envelope integrity protein CreD [Azoarcus sp.]
METHFEHVQGQASRHKKIDGFRTHPAGKLVGVLFLVLFLMVPLMFIEEQISSRQRYQGQVTAEIASTAASSQTITGPILAIHYRTRTPEKTYRDPHSGKMVTQQAGSAREHVEYMPARKLEINGDTRVESRYRGIYQARLFHLNATVEGSFEAPADLIKIPDGHEFVDASGSILFGVTDLRGLSSDPDVTVDGRSLRFKTPNDKRFEEVMAGRRLEIDLGVWTPDTVRTVAFAFPLKLTGTEALFISPTAENNIINLVSDWKHPSFGGRFLPREREINESGFTASWEVSQLARNLEDALKQKGEVLKVDFIDPVNIYLQAERAVKYGSLFIVLTFAAFFIGEFLRRRPMHIMQYALVGLSLAIFFLLLIALSEHLSFGLAYLAGAVACIGLIVSYLAGVFGSRRMASAFGAGLATL